METLHFISNGEDPYPNLETKNSLSLRNITRLFRLH